eukprot:SAG31_NODE_4029_length_3650_cov_1.509716_7_plen_305_part_00
MCTNDGFGVSGSPNEAECLLSATGFEFTPSIPGQCIESSTSQTIDDDDHCLDAKLACRGDDDCAAVLQTITDAAWGGASVEDVHSFFDEHLTMHDSPFRAFHQCLSDQNSLETIASRRANTGACDARQPRRLNATTVLQNVSMVGYENDMRCSWIIACSEGQPVMRVTSMAVEIGFDVVRAYDGDNRQTACNVTGCNVGCNESMCLTTGVGDMGYEGAYFASASPTIFLEFVSDSEIWFDDGGVTVQYQCVESLVYGCTDPNAANYDENATFNSVWKYGHDYCDQNGPCMGPRGPAMNELCSTM